MFSSTGRQGEACRCSDKGDWKEKRTGRGEGSLEGAGPPVDVLTPIAKSSILTIHNSFDHSVTPGFKFICFANSRLLIHHRVVFTNFVLYTNRFLADRTSRSMIGYWRHN